MVGIIDSIFRNFYVPPIIFAVTTQEDGTETKVCIDGKQRLTSIQKFMDGLIAHKDPLTNEKLYYTDLTAGSSKNVRPKRLLPEKYRRLFANKQIVCVEYQDITDRDEREIFQRVQLGMALTPAEKLQVINTPRARFVRELQQQFLKESDALAGEYLEWDRTRGSDFRCIAQTVFTLDNFGPAMKNVGTIPRIEKWLGEGGNFSSTFRDQVIKTFRLFAELAMDNTLGKCLRDESYSGGKVSPVEFVCIGLLIGVHGVGVIGSSGSGSAGGRKTMSLQDLSTAIGQMRDGVREEHRDIRLNDRVSKTLLEFIRSLFPQKRKREEEPEKDKSVETPAPKRKSPNSPSSLKRSSNGPGWPNAAVHPTPTRTAAPMKTSVSTPPVTDRLAVVRAAKAGRLHTGPLLLPGRTTSTRIQNSDVVVKQEESSSIPAMPPPPLPGHLMPITTGFLPHRPSSIENGTPTPTSPYHHYQQQRTPHRDRDRRVEPPLPPLSPTVSSGNGMARSWQPNESRGGEGWQLGGAHSSGRPPSPPAVREGWGWAGNSNRR